MTILMLKNGNRQKKIDPIIKIIKKSEEIFLLWIQIEGELIAWHLLEFAKKKPY